MHSPIPDIIPADMLLLAYRSGIFPMSESRDDPEIFWVEPRERAVIPLEGFILSRSLRKVLKQDRFSVTVDDNFAGVIDACAQPRTGHPETWISRRIAASYRLLHLGGHAHSIECRLDGELVGGLYGVAFDRVFCGESMFSRTTNASKVALAWLVALMKRGGFELLDCQFMTEHLASLGALPIPQEEYLKRLEQAMRSGERPDLRKAYSELVDEAESSSPGKLIAQSLTHTS